MGETTSKFFKSSDKVSNLSNHDQIPTRYPDDGNNGRVSLPSFDSVNHISNHHQIPTRHPDDINNGNNTSLPSYDSVPYLSDYDQITTEYLDDRNDELVSLSSWAQSDDSMEMAQLSQSSSYRSINRLNRQSSDSVPHVYNNDQIPTRYPDYELVSLPSWARTNLEQLSQQSNDVNRFNGQMSSALMQRNIPGNNPYLFQFSQPIRAVGTENDNKEQNVESSSNDCFICCRRKRNAGLLHRGNTVHQICCVPCGLKLKKLMHPCPVCRSPIKRVVRIYVS